MKADEIHELEQRMDALAREYGATRDPKILTEIKELADRLEKLKNKEKSLQRRTLH
jgi:hypothetical protein